MKNSFEIKRLTQNRLALMLFGITLFSAISINAQQINVSGTVSDANGPLPGASVIVKGTNLGTQTNFDGQYSLPNVNSNATLVFSYVGFAASEIAVNGRSVVNAVLEEDAQALDEVVVLGYSTVKKTDLTGAVQQVSGDDLPEIPAGSVGTLLAGRLSGVTITNANGAPGSTPNILVRGVRSVNASNAPLIILDGAIFVGDITDINPEDIESVNVLKDASSTAIYGFRGANGVIVITSKRGVAGKLRVSYNSSYGVYKAVSNIDYQNADQFVDFVSEAFRNTGNFSGPEDLPTVLFPVPFQNFQDGVSTDWHEVVVGSQTGIQQNHYFSVSGGSEQTKARMGIGYFDNEYIFPGSEFLRYSFNAAFDHVSKDKKVEFGANVNFNYSDRRLTPDPFQFLFRQSPLLQPFNEDGSIDIIPLGEDPFQINPLVNYIPGIRDEEEWRANTRLTGYFKYNFNDNLSFKINANAAFLSSFYGRFISADSPERFAQTTAQAQTQGFFNHNYSVNAILQYNKDFGKHNLNLLALGEIFRRVDRNQLTQGEGEFESLSFYNQENFLQNRLIESSFRRATSQSLFGEARYNYDNRFYLTAGLRYDGASQLSEDNRYALFPSAGARWRISEENWFNKDGALSALNLRFGVGQAGNQSVDPLATVGQLGSNITAFGAGAAGNPELTLFLDTVDSPDLGWEITTTYDLALEMGFWQNRINLSLNPYLTFTDDLILRRTLPGSSGFQSVFQNVGKTKVIGIDINLFANVIKTPNFSWDLEGNFTYYEDELVELFGGLDELVNDNLFVGERFQQVLFGEQFIGLWQEGDDFNITNINSVPGDPRFRDINSDNEITPDEDRIVLGSLAPNLRPSLRSIFRYKNLDLTALFDGAFGGVGYDRVRERAVIQTGRFGVANYDYWTPDNTDARYPRPIEGGQNPTTRRSAPFLEDMDWVKLRELTLGYTFGKKFQDAQSVIKNLRLTVSAQNLLLWSTYDWALDPELQGRLGNPNVGVASTDQGNPTVALVTFGIKADF